MKAQEIPDAKAIAANTVCPRCGASFGCGAIARRERCWCMGMPPLTVLSGKGCYCPACLTLLAASGTRPEN